MQAHQALWWGLPPEIWLSIATIMAIILGPILAVQIQKKIDLRREKRNRQLGIFRELMLTRGTRLSARHVEALNAIQMEFSATDKKERAVLDAWALYIQHLNLQDPPDMNVWGNKAGELLTDLLYAMAQDLAYDTNKAKIAGEAYAPRYFFDLENEQNELRKAAVEVFSGRQNLRVKIQE